MDAGLKDLFGLATLFVGVAALGLIISRSSDTAKVIQATTSGFGSLLSIVQNPGSSSSLTNVSSSLM